MTGDLLPADLAGQTAAPMGNNKAACGTGAAAAAIMVVGRDADARHNLCQELTVRYGADYRIVVCDRPSLNAEPGTCWRAASRSRW